MPKINRYEPAIEKKRAVSIVVYDMRGGPIHPDIISYLEDAAFNAAQMADGIVINTTVE